MAFSKDPHAVLDFAIDWAGWLQPGDQLTSVECFLVPVETNGLEEDVTAIDGVRTVSWLSGGVVGKTYKITHRVTSQDGRIDDRTFSVKIKEK